MLISNTGGGGGGETFALGPGSHLLLLHPEASECGIGVNDTWACLVTGALGLDRETHRVEVKRVLTSYRTHTSDEGMVALDVASTDASLVLIGRQTSNIIEGEIIIVPSVKKEDCNEQE